MERLLGSIVTGFGRGIGFLLAKIVMRSPVIVLVFAALVYWLYTK